MDKTKTEAEQILTLYYQGKYIWQIARILDITEARVVSALGLG